MNYVQATASQAVPAFPSSAANTNIVELQRAHDDRDALETRLFQAQKMEAIGQLAGGLAHDFNNLLAIVIGRLAEVEASMADHAELQQQVGACKGAVEQTALLTRSMLAVLRQQTLSPVTFRMDKAADDLLRLVRHALGRGIAVQVDRAADLWPCHADPAQLQNALLNLVLNARDAMPKGGRITVAMRNAAPDARPGDYVVLSVRDTGSGMTQEVLDRAVEPFFTTKPAGKGSGLGLSLVHGFAARSGGQLHIESGPGRGTMVEIHLPRA